MQDKLEEIFSLQKSFENMMNLDRYPKDVEEKNFCFMYRYDS